MVTKLWQRPVVRVVAHCFDLHFQPALCRVQDPGLGHSSASFFDSEQTLTLCASTIMATRSTKVTLVDPEVGCPK